VSQLLILGLCSEVD